MGKKLWITTGIIGALAAAYTAGGFLGVPYGVNWALKKYAEPIVGRTITTQEVKFNPFTLQFSVKGLNVQKDGEPPLLSVGYLKTKVLWNQTVSAGSVHHGRRAQQHRYQNRAGYF